MSKNIKPFVKWAGGKTQLLQTLHENFNYNCQKYIETFVGGGALFFSLLNMIEKTNIEKIIINDINKKLMITYSTIRDNVDLLIKELILLENKYNNLSSLEAKEELYYLIRKEFNQNSKDYINTSRNFIFLNKTDFNGLYRENSKGDFNVPFGKREKVNLLEEENLLEISRKLNVRKNGERIIEIKNMDYNDLIDKIDKNTMIYLDPPYRPITKNGFTSYNKSNFNDDNQVELLKFCNKITELKACFMLSNSDPHNLDINDNFFDTLYKEYNIQRVQARRNINSSGTGRGNVTELLIKNY